MLATGIGFIGKASRVAYVGVLLFGLRDEKQARRDIARQGYHIYRMTPGWYPVPA